jgi:hypothetical protein
VSSGYNILVRMFHPPICNANILLVILRAHETWSLMLRKEHGLMGFEKKRY